MNSAGNLLDFHQAALDVRQEFLSEKEEYDAILYEFWGIISVNSSLRIIGLRVAF